MRTRPAPRRSTRSSSGRAPVVSGGTGLYLRAAVADLRFRRRSSPSCRRIQREVDTTGRGTPSARGAGSVAAQAVHAHDRSVSSRRWSSPRTGESLVAGGAGSGWRHRRPTLVVGLDVAPGLLERRIRERTEKMFARGVVDEVRAAIRCSVRRRREDARLAEIARLGPDALEPIVARARGTPRISASGCAGSRLSSSSTRGSAEAIADDIVQLRCRLASFSMRFEKWHALGNAYLLVEQPDAGELSAARVRRLCDVDTGIGSDGLLEVTGRDAARAVSASGIPTARLRSSPATALASPPPGCCGRAACRRSRSRPRASLSAPRPEGATWSARSSAPSRSATTRCSTSPGSGSRSSRSTSATRTL